MVHNQNERHDFFHTSTHGYGFEWRIRGAHDTAWRVEGADRVRIGADSAALVVARIVGLWARASLVNHDLGTVESADKLIGGLESDALGGDGAECVNIFIA